MIRKSLIYIAMSLAALCSTTTASAQGMVGDWQIFPVFGLNIDNVIDGNDKVYYMSAGCLYSYDKDTHESYAYSTRNKLNDTQISQIYYNANRGFLAIAYKSAKIDLLFDDGHVVMLGDIPDAVLNITKSINDIAFDDGDRMYVATSFGMVVFDTKNGNVVESGIYDRSLGPITVLNDHIVVGDPSNYALMASPKDIRHNQFSTFTILTGGNQFISLTKVENGLLMRTTKEAVPLQLLKVNPETFKSLSKTPTDIFTKSTVATTADGTPYTVSKSNSLIRFNADGSVLDSVALPEPLIGQKLAMNRDLASIWGGDALGIANYSLGADGSLTVLADKYKPVATTANEIAYIEGSADGSRIYITNIGETNNKSIGSMGLGQKIMQRTDVLINGVPRDAAMFDCVVNKMSGTQSDSGTKRMFGGPQRIAVDPEDPDRYFLASWTEGVYVVKDNQQVGKFDVSNMPVRDWWSPKNKPGLQSMDVIFDPDGNLWVGYWTQSADYSPYVVLPRAKVQGDLSTVTAADWKQSKHKGVDDGFKDMGSIFSTTSGMFFNWTGKGQSPLGVTDTRRTYANTDDDLGMTELASAVDQDGKPVSPALWICAAEDQRGRIWFGTTEGVVEITNPARALDADFTFTRLKVPRNDGTNYADYLLDSEQVNAIAVDGSNRKWLATETSGVYLVSENGDKILEHFTAENSALPANAVYSIYCDPNSNIVYFGLKTGLVSYNSTSSPAAADYSDVYAYPNPVRPDYTGFITIKGLMDKSVVKIADAQGSVVYQTRSEGGMVVWDGCNADGTRVKTGVYFVFASQNATGDNSGAVTKILVVN